VSKKRSSFATITWEDLDTWAGEKVVSRARRYKQNVQDLRMTKDQELLGWVQGTKRYAAEVWIDGSGSLLCECTCPYDWGPCKHCVALILVYLDALKNRTEVKQASSDDQRRQILTHNAAECGKDFPDMDEYQTPTEPLAPNLRSKFDSMKKKELVGLLMQVVVAHPEIGKEILEQEEAKSGEVEGIVEAVRCDIEKMCGEPDWDEYDWRNPYDATAPDLSSIHKRFDLLVKSGHADEVLELGLELLDQSEDLIERYDHDGEVSMDLAPCMEIVLNTVEDSSLSPSQQILWLIDASHADPYDIIYDVNQYLNREKYDMPAWSEAADVLLGRLSKRPTKKQRDDVAPSYRRQRVMNRAIQALENSDREKEIIPLLEQEAPITDCYELLVDRLVAANRTEEAKKAAIDGTRKTRGKYDGIAWRLAEKLREIASAEKDHPLAAAYRALEFFDRPSLHLYQPLKEDLHNADLWPSVREGLLNFLETGIRPDMASTNGQQNKASKPPKGWPLPAPEVPADMVTAGRRIFPDAETLVHIAIYELRNDDALKWFKRVKKASWGNSLDLTVAKAVKETHPYVSLEIWKKSAEREIGHVKPAAYKVAGAYLAEMRSVYEQVNRCEEWTAYVLALRTTHKRKTRLMEVLDSVEGKRIIET
jgi:uncharacterized Zn finger protein